MTRRCFVTVALLLGVTPCLAHHSFAMFDQAKAVTLHGTVKQLQWTNPHCYLQVLVPTRNVTAEWSIEMHSPLAMYRVGWRPGSYRPGDKVTVVINPLKNGANGGRLLTATDAGGRTLGTERQQPVGKPLP